MLADEHGRLPPPVRPGCPDCAPPIRCSTRSGWPPGVSTASTSVDRSPNGNTPIPVTLRPARRRRSSRPLRSPSRLMQVSAASRMRLFGRGVVAPDRPRPRHRRSARRCHRLVLSLARPINLEPLTRTIEQLLSPCSSHGKHGEDRGRAPVAPSGQNRGATVTSGVTKRIRQGMVPAPAREKGNGGG